MHLRLAAPLLIAVVHLGASAQERIGVIASYLEAAAQYEAIQQTECGRYMGPGDRLTYEQAVSDARAKLPESKRQQFDAAISAPNFTKGISATQQVAVQNLVALSEAKGIVFACGYLIGFIQGSTKDAVRKFKELE